MIGLLRTFCVLAILIHVCPVQAGSIFGNKTVGKVEWQTDLKKAAVESQRSGKPILIQMTAPWCSYCHKMLKETFTDPAIAKLVNEQFVPLLLDADANENVVETLAVSSFPSTIIISSQIDELGRIDGFHKPAVYGPKLAPFAASGRAKLTGAAAPAPAAAAREPEVPLPTEPKRLVPAAIQTPQTLEVAEERVPFVPPLMQERQPIVKTPNAAVPQVVTPHEVAAKVAASPVKIAFAGICLVSTLEEREPVAGSAKFPLSYKGRQLQFVSAEQLAKFKANPDAYWPHNDGHCPVALTRDDRQTEGDPQSAGVYQKRLVFFVDAAHRDEFGSSPKHYTAGAIQRAGSLR